VIKRFEEKSVLITGASRGIGKGIAKRFAEEGANLILSAITIARIEELSESDWRTWPVW
jgi:NAD(P)-dependent dehydrogenase (short-subunit alcohol dehydrogenase family)